MAKTNIIVSGEIKSNYTKVSNSLLYDTRLSAEAVRVFQIMVNMGYKQQYCTADILADTLKKSPASIKKYLNELIAAKWLDRICCGEIQNGKAVKLTQYRLCLENVLQTIQQEQQEPAEQTEIDMSEFTEEELTGIIESTQGKLPIAEPKALQGNVAALTSVPKSTADIREPGQKEKPAQQVKQAAGSKTAPNLSEFQLKYITDIAIKQGVNGKKREAFIECVADYKRMTNKMLPTYVMQEIADRLGAGGGVEEMVSYIQKHSVLW